MHRKTGYRWVAALALVAVLEVMGARPAAAADLGVMERLGSLWSAVAERPAALWNALLGWFGDSEKPSPQKREDDQENGWGIDPIGGPSGSSSSAAEDGSK